MMQLSIFGYVVLIIIVSAVLGATITAVIAWRKQSLFIFDAGTIFLSPVVFYLLGSMRSEFRGLGLAIWPIIILVLGMLLFCLRVGVVDRIFQSPRINAMVLCGLYIGAAIIGGLGMPPWYE